ncbi:MAG: DUF1349 domain-containing protein [Chloroflexi bacterium]|nr:DUF1349 domain-containing protein [Chloroflexota bacterium]
MQKRRLMIGIILVLLVVTLTINLTPGMADSPQKPGAQDDWAFELPSVDFEGLNAHLGAQFNNPRQAVRITWAAEMTADVFDRLYYPGETAHITVTINAGNRAQEFSGHIVFAVMQEERDEAELYYDGVRIVPEDIVTAVPLGDLALEPNETYEATIDFQAPETGLYGVYVVATTARGDTAVWLGNVGTIYPPEPGFQYDSYFMGDTRAVDGAAQAIELETLQKIGVQWTRASFMWSQTERQPGVFDWTAMDAAMQRFHEREMYVLLLGDNGAGWERNADIQGRDVTPNPAYYGAWANYWYEVITRYGDVARAINVWNEPWESGGISGWEGTAQHYRNLSRYAMQGVKAADPSVLVGGADSHDNTNDVLLSDPTWPELFDLITYHGADDPGGYYANRLVDLPVWNTESWYTAQLPRTVQQHMWAIASGAEKVNMVVLGNFFSGHVDAGDYYTPDLENPQQFSPQPNAIGYATMTHFLEGTTFVEERNPVRVPYSFIFEGEDGYVAVLFGIPVDPNFFPNNQTVTPGTMSINAAGLAAFDHYGRSVEADGDQFVLPFAEEPVYLTADSLEALQAAIDGIVVEETEPVYVTLRDITQPLDAGVPVDITLTNVVNQPLSGTLAVTLPDGWQADTTELAFEDLAPGESRVFTLTLTEAAANAENSYPIGVTVTTASGTAVWNENIEVHVIACASPIIDGDTSGDLAALTPVTLSNADGTFGGQVALAYDTDYLYLLAEVTDPTDDAPPNPLYDWFSLGEDNFFYTTHPQWLFYYDNIQLAINSRPNPDDYLWPVDHPYHRRQPARETDYLYAFYQTAPVVVDDETAIEAEAQAWQLFLPGSDRRNRYPFSPPTEGVAQDVLVQISQQGDVRMVEVAIPLGNIPELAARQDIPLAVKLSDATQSVLYSNSGRSSSDFDLSVFEPYWWTSPRGSYLGTLWGFGAGDACGAPVEVPALAAVPTEPEGTGTGLQGDYFDNADFTEPRLTRLDAQPNRDWGFGSPNMIAITNTPGMALENLIDPDTFSVRWTGQIVPRFSETYTFHALTDGTVKLSLGDTVVLDGATEGQIDLDAGQAYDIVLEYAHDDGHARLRLAWESPSQLWQIVPQAQLYPPEACCDTAFIPSPPAYVLATPADGSGSSVRLTWALGAGAESYAIYRSEELDGPFEPVATAVVDVTYTDTGLSTGTAYYYAVSAVSSLGEGPLSDPLRVVAAPIQILEAENAVLSGAASAQNVGGAASGGVQVLLPDELGAALTFPNVEVDTSGEYLVSVRFSARVNDNTKSLLVNDVDIAQLEFDATSGVNGNSTDFDVVTVVVPLEAGTNTLELQDYFGDEGSAIIDRVVIAPVDAELPTAPPDGTVSEVTNTTATVAWQEGQDNVGIIAYEVYAGDELLSITNGQTSAQLSGLTPGTSYTVSVFARDVAHNLSTDSASITFTTGPTPVELAAMPGDGLVNLEWQGGTDGITYELLRRAEESDTFEVLATDIESTSYVDDTIELTTYYYQVTAYQDGSNVGSTDIVTVVPLPGAWLAADVGTVWSPGSVAYDSETESFTMRSAGDIWWSNDILYYVYQPLSGDGEITARVVSVEMVDVWTKAGVMIREELTGGSKHTFMMISGAAEAGFQHRPVPNSDSRHTSAGAIYAPAWVRLNRTGNTFTGYISTDGENWELVDSIELEMAEDVYIGFTLCSSEPDSPDLYATAVFDNITVVIP